MLSSSGLTFKLHPLVIVNISDHYTRIKAQQSGSASPLPLPRVYGCVLGVQTGRTVEVFNSFELHYDATQNVLDRAFLESKQEQCKSHVVVLAKKKDPDVRGQAVIGCCQFFYRVRARVCKRFVSQIGGNLSPFFMISECLLFSASAGPDCVLGVHVPFWIP
jgi:hypothetical protein